MVHALYVSAPLSVPPPPLLSHWASASLETTHICQREPRSPQVESTHVSESVLGSFPQAEGLPFCCRWPSLLCALTLGQQLVEKAEKGHQPAVLIPDIS